MSFLDNLKNTVDEGKDFLDEGRDEFNQKKEKLEDELRKGREFNSQGTGFQPSPLEEELFGEQETQKKDKEDRDPRVSIDIY